MNRKEFYEEICKLAPSEYDASKCDFRKHLESLFDKYIDLLDRAYESKCLKINSKIWKYVRYEIIELIEAIKETVKLYYEGRHSKAYNYFEKNIDNDHYKLQMADLLISDFYRMRTFEEGEKHNREGMFHIPFNKRTIVKTQRFSAPGYPCLYLGASAYICWEEMLRPNLDKCYVSRFHSDNSILVFDLSLPFNVEFKENEFPPVLYRLPLVIACMVKVSKPKDTFKPEYIIPQLVMEYVIGLGITYNHFHGIAYTSVHKSDDFEFDPLKSINLVMPAFSPFEGNYSEELCKMFVVTEPTCDELERAKCPYQAIERDEKISDLEYSYRISTFGQLEARLKDETKFPLKKIDNSTFGS